jgi:DNA (cytosine-5)-methyltransferase 1
MPTPSLVRRFPLFESPDPPPSVPKAISTNQSVISLFSGCGGLDLGFRGGFQVYGRLYERLPYEIVWANEINAAACRTYRRNLGKHIVEGDIWERMDDMPSSADLVIGGFPCQDISVNGKGAGANGKRSGLYRAMVEVIQRIQPKAFVAENVKGLLMKHNRDSLAQVLKDFGSLGYEVSYSLYNAANYGVPQERHRVFIVGTAKGRPAFVPPVPVSEWNRMTAEDAICDLEPLPEDPSVNHIWSRAEISPDQGNRRLRPDRPAQTIRAECHGNIQFHYALPRRLSMREAARIQSFPDEFIFEAKLRETERQVGNAVPPVLGWHIANAILPCIADSARQLGAQWSSNPSSKASSPM